VAKAEVKKEEKKVAPKTETPQAPKLAEKKKSAPGDAKKVAADKYDKVDPNSKLVGMHIS